MASLLDRAVNGARDLYESARDKVASIPGELAARGSVTTRVKPFHSADLDIATMAEDSAQRQGRGSKSPLNSTMTPISKKGK